MPVVSDHSLPTLVIGAAVGAWILSIAGILVMRWHYSRKLERLGESNSEEMIDELKEAYTATPKVRIQTQTEYLPFVIETIRENIESGLEEDQVQLLLERIEHHRIGRERRAMFNVEAKQSRSELRLAWICDAQHRIDLTIQGHASIIRPLRELKKRIPKAAIYGQAGRS